MNKINYITSSNIDHGILFGGGSSEWWWCGGEWCGWWWCCGVVGGVWWWWRPWAAPTQQLRQF